MICSYVDDFVGDVSCFSLFVCCLRRSIATLAITTLLKTGTEGSVDRLMKQISSFMNEIADEFKIVVVKAIRQVSKEAF